MDEKKIIGEYDFTPAYNLCAEQKDGRPYNFLEYTFTLSNARTVNYKLPTCIFNKIKRPMADDIKIRFYENNNNLISWKLHRPGGAVEMDI